MCLTCGRRPGFAISVSNLIFFDTCQSNLFNDVASPLFTKGHVLLVSFLQFSHQEKAKGEEQVEVAEQSKAEEEKEDENERLARFASRTDCLTYALTVLHMH